MNEQPASEWTELSRMWQADAAAVSLDEIDGHVRRERLKLRVVTTVELAGAALGVCAAAWLAFFTPFLWMGTVVGIFAVVSAFAVIRLRRVPEPSGADGLMHSLKESIGREDWVAEQLRFGRALSFVALFAIVMATASQLLRFHTISAVGLAAASAGAAYVAGVLVWNLVLTRRTHVRRARLVYLNDRLKS
jgi:hypothetical protein